MSDLHELNAAMTLPECLNHTFSCSCGRTHTAALKAAIVEKDAIGKLPELLKSRGWKNVYLVCDSVTKKIAGDKARELLEVAGMDVCFHVVNHLAYDEGTLGEILIHIKEDRDVVIGVGTGSINDMCRYFSFKMGLPYGIIATAAPMDGFASSISALTVDNLKTTFEVRTPEFIIGDTEILKNAPYSLISAGLGDLMGKFTCLCDWKLSKLINDEYYCETIVEMVDHCVRGVLENADKVKDRNPQVIGDIMEGLVFTGVAMSMIGNSRPASGCEHHISHYFETIFEQKGEKPAPHGHQVGVGTILILRLTERLRKLPQVDFERAREAAKAYDFDKWCKKIEEAYGPAAPGVIEMEKKSQKNETTGRLNRIDKMEESWQTILELLNELPTSREIIHRMSELGAPCFPFQIGVNREMLRNTLLYCKEIRARYTILQMLWDLDLLEELTDQVVEEIDGILDSGAYGNP